MIKLQISGSNGLHLTVLTTSSGYSNCSGRGYLTLVVRYAIAIISYYYVKTCLINLLYSPIIVHCSFNAQKPTKHEVFDEPVTDDNHAQRLFAIRKWLDDEK
jgi:hypothetical protein